MKRSKKYQRKIKKRLLGCLSSITVCLMLIAGSKLAGLSMPIRRGTLHVPAEKTSSTKSNADQATVGKGERAEMRLSLYKILLGDINRLQNTETVEYIYTIDDLVRFRDSVNAGNDYAGKNVYVMADIDMSTVCSETIGSWEPIGTDATTFAGTFDGNYHKISNLYFNSNNFNQFVGLFTINNGIIQNLILEDINIYAYKTGEYEPIIVGGLVGWNTGIIINCGVNSGSITAYNNTAINTYWRNIIAGGIAGGNGAGDTSAKIIY